MQPRCAAAPAQFGRRAVRWAGWQCPRVAPPTRPLRVPPGTTLCDQGSRRPVCALLANDTENCGSCGTRCLGTGMTCLAGQCQCKQGDGGWSCRCAGAGRVPLCLLCVCKCVPSALFKRTWPRPLTSWRAPLPDPARTGYTACGNNLCADLQTDFYHCGSCANSCLNMQGAVKCQFGQCVPGSQVLCGGGLTDCRSVHLTPPGPGDCRDLETDLNSCGMW